MPARIAERSEPLPGYRLLEKLGNGGFGEVWKAEAPGGLPKAIKFVRGILEDGDEGDLTARQEFKALQRVKELHHPFILSLERADVVDGQLVIVMELADRNLWDRFEECKKQGLPGIPREELLRYMEEAAEALDLMNAECRLQHLDVKPQNLFLIHRHVKVADFGLAKDLQGTHAELTGGITPVYAAPETFEGKVSHYCDQYSLAIVFQELLTGTRPFNGKNARQLLIEHLRAEPDLGALPEADRAAVGRALSKKPADRFPCCLDFVRALKRNPADGPPVVAAKAPCVSAPTPLPAAAAVKRPAPVPKKREPAPEQETVALADLPAPRPAVKHQPPAKTKARKCQRCGAEQPGRSSLGLCVRCGYCPALDGRDEAPGVSPWAWFGVALATGLGAAAALLLS